MTKLKFTLKIFFGILLFIIVLLLITKNKYYFKFHDGSNPQAQIKTEDLNIKKSKSPMALDDEVKALDIFNYGEIPKFNPISPDGLYVWWLQGLVWDKLIFVDKKFIWTPNLASSWVFSKDKTDLSLKFDSDIFWSNGRKVSEADFVFSFSFYKDDSLKAAIYKPILERIGHVTYKDQTLRLKLNSKLKADPFFATHIYWSHVLSTVQLYPADLKTNSYLGTGPYKVDVFSNSGKIKFSLNKNSWFLKKYQGIGLPKVINVKSLISESVLENIVNKSKGLIMGKDIYPINIPGWHPVESNHEMVSIYLNLKDVPIETRYYLYQKISEANDLEKLNLKFREKTIYGFNNPVVKKQLAYKSSVKYFTSADKNKNIKLNILYDEPKDEVWLTYLNEKLKLVGVELVFNKMSSSVFQEAIFNKKFMSFVDRNKVDDFYPHYLSFHSKGSYNFSGWNNPAIDHDLELMIKMDNPDLIKNQIKKIRKEIEKDYFQVPIISYQSAVLWTRNPCKPIQKQFQGLGLIYKAIICADNL